ncbi:MAG TPA: EVE domain-containing protein [Dongiaceae bacterium]|nr:EVE domain-containing protein [Dongiaceae bacterium]
MRYWLMKSEPSAYSWQQLRADKKTGWSGVRNHQAALNLKAMKKGDRAFFYHSNEGKEIVGICEITREAYPDPSDSTGRFVQVDVVPLEEFARPVTLAAIKQTPALTDIALVRLSRLSVQPVSAAHWKIICGMSKKSGEEKSDKRTNHSR